MSFKPVGRAYYADLVYVRLDNPRSFVEWPKIKELRADLELQQRTIAEQVAKIDAAEALELMWRFLALANSVLGRCDDSSGVVGDIFRGAVEDLARLARVVKPAPDMLADKVYAALLENRFGQSDRLIEALVEPRPLHPRIHPLIRPASPRATALECVRKSAKQFSDKTHDKTKT